MFEMLAVTFGESIMKRTQVQLWYKRLKKDREDINDSARSGGPSAVTTDKNIESVQEMTSDNRRFTVREIADYVDMPFGLCQAILTNVLIIKKRQRKFFKNR